MRLHSAVAAAALLFASALSSLQAQKQRFASLEEALRSGGALAGRNGPDEVNWIDGGARFSYIDIDRQNGQPVIRVFDPASGSDTLLFSATGLTFPASRNAFSYESFQWARDSKHILFQTNVKEIFRHSATADYYIYSVDDKRLKLATRGARTAELSPDGAWLGYERDGDMYVTNLLQQQERRLTGDAAEHVFNGHFDWVYEEEFGMTQAWKWSPDSRYIAFWQTDDSTEPVTQLTSYDGHHPSWERLPIPQPGDSNATVKIGVVNIQTGSRTWLDTGEQGEFYIPRIYWTSQPDTLAVLTLNRAHNVLTVYFFDVKTGGRRQVFRETSKTWIDVYDFYARIQDMMSFPEGSREFFWISDRDGWQHVYRYDYSGKLIRQVTSGKWNVTRIEGIDSKRRMMYYASTQDSPLQRQLYAIGLDGKNPRRLTAERGTHRIDMSPNTQYFIDRWSSTTQPTQVVLRSADGKVERSMETNASVTEWINTHEYSPTTLFSFTTSDSVRIDGYMIKPIPFDANKKYPVIFQVYGGPGSQDVYDRFNANPSQQWLAQQGYIIVSLNNRASNNYGSAFMKIVHKQLGKWESHDFAEAAKYMSTLSYVDAANIGIMGTSYGGYATMYTMEMYPHLFKAGIANSGVADWRYYDSIYTERYMGLLDDNFEGYQQSSAIVNAPKLQGKLLIIHGMMDDNVHPQHTMQLLTAFTNANKDVELRIYPQGRHGSAYNLQSYMLINRLTDEFFAKHLKPAAAAPGSQAE